jgi:hypothetical protein
LSLPNILLLLHKAPDYVKLFPSAIAVIKEYLFFQQLFHVHISSNSYHIKKDGLDTVLPLESVVSILACIMMAAGNPSNGRCPATSFTRVPVA